MGGAPPRLALALALALASALALAPTLTRYDWRAPALHETEWAKQFGFSALAHRFALLNVSFVDQRADGHVGGAMAYHSDPAKAAAGRDCLHD